MQVAPHFSNVICLFSLTFCFASRTFWTCDKLSWSSQWCHSSKSFCCNTSGQSLILLSVIDGESFMDWSISCRLKVLNVVKHVKAPRFPYFWFDFLMYLMLVFCLFLHGIVCGHEWWVDSILYGRLKLLLIVLHGDIHNCGEGTVKCFHLVWIKHEFAFYHVCPIHLLCPNKLLLCPLSWWFDLQVLPFWLWMTALGVV